jgi:hypothetical protein
MHYEAEGNARFPFHTWISVHNPADTDVDVQVALRLDDGSTRERTLQLAPLSCSTLDASELAGVEGHAFAIDVTLAGQAIVLRTVAWDDTPASADGGPRLRLAGRWQAQPDPGAAPGAHLLIENVGDAAAMAEVEHLTGGTRVRQTVLVPPHGARVVRSASAACRDVTRVVGTSRYFAGGETGRGAETILTLTNHAGFAATVDVRYLPETHGPVLRRHVVAPHARITIAAGEDAGFRRPESFGMHVRSVDGIAVDVERSTWWPAADADGRAEGLGCDGAATPGSEFELPVDAVEDAAAVVLMANPGDVPAHVHVVAIGGQGHEQALADLTIPCGQLQRTHLTLGHLNGDAHPTAIRVVCDDDARIVVERASGPDELGPGARGTCIGIPAIRLR